jgi:predicted negative regulator of RcsB-dependent stress response
VVLEHYGDILYKLGRKDKALEFWIQAGGKTDASEALHKKIKDKKINEE